MPAHEKRRERPIILSRQGTRLLIGHPAAYESIKVACCLEPVECVVADQSRGIIVRKIKPSRRVILAMAFVIGTVLVCVVPRQAPFIQPLTYITVTDLAVCGEDGRAAIRLIGRVGLTGKDPGTARHTCPEG